MLPNRYMRTSSKGVRLAANGLMVAVGMILLVSCGSSGTAKDARVVTVPFRVYSPAANAAFAVELAAGMWDRHPTEVTMINTTRASALSVIGHGGKVMGGVPPGTPVRVFALHGEFVSSGPRPPRTRAPTGTWLTESVDIATGSVLDLSLDDRRPDLASLGKVTRLVPAE
jgi:hypothetical protein